MKTEYEKARVLRRPVAFAAHVRHDDTAVVEGNVGELEIAADVAGSPDVRNIGPQVFVGNDSASVREGNTGFFSFETIRIGTAARCIKMASPSKTVSVSPTV